MKDAPILLIPIFLTKLIKGIEARPHSIGIIVPAFSIVNPVVSFTKIIIMFTRGHLWL